jgi:hypothetical protein
VLFGLIVSIILVTNTAAKPSFLEDVFSYPWKLFWFKVAFSAARTLVFKLHVICDARRAEHLLAAWVADFGIPNDIVAYGTLKIRV